MPNKKSKENGYSVFTREHLDREKKKGRSLSFVQASQETNPLWIKMPPAERKPYEDRAKQINKEKKYTCTGIEIDEAKRRAQEEREQEIAMADMVKDLVHNPIDVTETIFYIANINSYCFVTSENRFIPAEIAIIRFNIQDGINLDDIFHVILDPGNLPVGYHLTAANAIHGIPVPPHDDHDILTQISIRPRSYREVFRKMVDYLQYNRSSCDPLPVIFVDQPYMKATNSVFTNFANEFGLPVGLEFKFSLLANLLFELKERMKEGMYRLTLAQEEFTKDIFDNVKGISCKFHKDDDFNFKECAMSKCIRQAYIICNHTVGLYNVKVVSGAHVPHNTKFDQKQNASWSTSPYPEKPTSGEIDTETASCKQKLVRKEQSLEKSESVVSLSSKIYSPTKPDTEENNIVREGQNPESFEVVSYDGKKPPAAIDNSPPISRKPQPSMPAISQLSINESATDRQFALHTSNDNNSPSLAPPSSSAAAVVAEKKEALKAPIQPRRPNTTSKTLEHKLAQAQRHTNCSSEMLASRGIGRGRGRGVYFS